MDLDKLAATFKIQSKVSQTHSMNLHKIHSAIQLSATIKIRIFIKSFQSIFCMQHNHVSYYAYQQVVIAYNHHINTLNIHHIL